MKTANYLSRLILTISILVSGCVFIIFPMFLEDTSNEEIALCTLRDTWDEENLLLPVPTKFAITFADHKATRIVIFSLFIIAGVLFEVLCRNKTVTGTYHSVFLLLCIMLGAYLFIACILPCMPC